MATPYRKDVEVDLTWDLTRIFKNDQEWEKEFAKIQQEIAELTTLKGKLSTSGTDLYENFSKILKVSREIEKVYVYSTLSSDQDTNNSHYLGFVARVQSLYNDFSAATAFVDPEILDIPEKTIEQFKKDEPRLAEFAHRLDTLNQKRKHTLSSDQEKIIAAASDALNTSENTYNILTNSDMEYGYVEDEDGNTEQLSDGLYSNLIQSQNREVRKQAFDTMFATYGQFENSLASTLSGVVKAHNYNAKMHKYHSAREASLNENGVPTVVYDTLLAEVNKHINLLHRYVALRKKLLKINDLQMYDMYVPLTGQPSDHYDINKAKEIALEALKPLGED